MRIYLPDFIDWCNSNILQLDLVITIPVLLFILYARGKEMYYAKDYKHVIAIGWHWKMVGTVILWSLFVMTTLLYHFSF